MKMEFLLDGSPDCPLIRLYDFDTLEACRLQKLILDMAQEQVNEVSLREALSIEAIAGCNLVLQASDQDQGIIRDASAGTFLCRLRRSSWQSVAGRVSPFCVDNAEGTYQWLDDTSPISWLLSANGLW